MLAELKKCAKDPVYFIRNYVWIRSTTKGLIPFNMFDYQEQLVRDYQNHRFNVILKARQLGISEISAAFAAWLMLFRRQRTVLVIATTEEVAKNLLRKIQTALKNLPKWMLSNDDGSYAKFILENKKTIELSTGSLAKALASKENSAHSEAVSFFIVDEASRIANLEELWKGIYHTVQSGGRLAVLSTPNGVGNFFHRLYDDAEKKVNKFKATKLMWYVHPEHIVNEDGIVDLENDPDRYGMKTSSWYREEVKSANLSVRQIAEQFECNFNSSGHTVIRAEDIQWIEQSCCLDPISKEYYDKELWTWHPALIDERYHISVDVARGDARDFSAATVWKSSDMSEVSEYIGKLPVEDFAKLICKMGYDYNSALLVIENNSLGLAVIEHVRLLGYPNVYFSTRGDSHSGDVVNMRWGSLNPNLIPGFTTSTAKRALMIQKLEEYIRNKTIHIRSRRLLEEIRTFVWVDDARGSNAKAEAAKSKHDDLFMSTAIGVWVKDTYISPQGTGLELQRKIFDSISNEITYNSSIPGASKDPRIKMVRDPFLSNNGQRTKMILPNGDIEDISYLLKG